MSVLSLRQENALALGVRNFDEPEVPFKSRFGNKLTTIVFLALYGKKIRDTQTGLRAIPNAFLRECLDIGGERFEYEIQMLIAAARGRQQLVEVPIQTVYFDDNRETHFHPVKDSIRIYSIFFKYLMASCATSFFDYIIFFITFSISKKLAFSMTAARLGAVFISFNLQKNFVFKYRKRTVPAFFRFVLLVTVSGLVSYGLISYFSTRTHANVIILKLVTESLIFIANYFIQKKFVWKQDDHCFRRKTK